MKISELLFLDLFRTFRKVNQDNVSTQIPLKESLALKNSTSTPKLNNLRDVIQLVFFGEFKAKTYLVYCLYVLESASRNILSIIMSLLINSISNDDESKWIYAYVLVTLSIIANVCRHQAITQSMEFSAQSRFTLLTTLYSKLLNSNSQSDQIIGLATADISMLEYYFMLIFQIFVMPISFIFGSVILCVRFNSLIGLIAIFIVTLIYPLQISIQKLSIHYTKQYKSYQDQRLKLQSEFIDNIKIIKMYNIQQKHKERIIKLRKLEQQSLIKSQMISLIDRTFNFFAQIWSSLIFFIILYYFNYELSVPAMIATIQQLQYFKVSCVQQVSYGIQSFLNIKMIFKRYVDTYNSLKNDQRQIKITQNSPMLVLNSKTYNLTINKNDFIVITGQIGSGKSMLLLSLLNQAPSTYQGEIIQQKILSKSFVEQDPVLFQDTIKNNIIFGRIFIEELYYKVIQTVCLDHDIKQMQNGDQTIVNDSGTNLSGGQKTRIALARALYALTDLIILDDPFSSLDIPIQITILQNLKKFLSTYHTTQTNMKPSVVLATHSQTIIRAFQQYYVLENGNLNLHHNDQIVDYQEQQVDNFNQNVERKETQNNSSNTLILANQQNKFYYYFSNWNQQKLISLLIVFITLLLNVNSEILYNLYYRGISQFNNDWSAFYYLICICIGSFINNYIKYNVNALGCYSANSQLHNRMIDSVANGKMSYFDKNPSSTILSKFSNDLTTADNMITVTLFDFWELGSYFLASLFSLVILHPQLILLMVLAITLNYSIFNKYRSLILKSQEFDQKTKAPLLGLFKKTVQGLRTIRIFEQEDYFKRQFITAINNTINANTTYYYLQRLFAINIDLVGLFGQIIGIAFLLALGKSESFVQALLLLMIFNENQQWFLRQFLNLSAQMNSIGRMQELTSIPQESKAINLQQLNGNVNFKNVNLKYENNYALQGFNIQINQGQKVGIIGRTGAGKSSIISILFKLYDTESAEKLEIDGVDIREMGIEQLRNSISIIPQNPTIFNDSIRNNIDQHQQHTDEEIFNVLKEVELYNYVKSMPNQLDSKFTELSQGNKQLVCLSRVLLQNRQIIVMDEATSNIDSQTDQLIQHIFKQHFNNKTVITIAHKTETLKNYDKIIVMENGKVIKEGSPNEIIKQ